MHFEPDVYVDYVDYSALIYYNIICNLQALCSKFSSLPSVYIYIQFNLNAKICTTQCDQ